MAIDRVLMSMAFAIVATVSLALAIALVVLTILDQAFGQFNYVLKTVLRSAKDEPHPLPVRLRMIAGAAVAAAIGSLSLLVGFLTR